MSKDVIKEMIHTQRTCEELIFQTLISKPYMQDMNVSVLRDLAREAQLICSNFNHRFDKVKNPVLLDDDYYKHPLSTVHLISKNGLKEWPQPKRVD